MRLVKDFLVVRDQLVITLENGKPCPHCRGKKRVPITDHLVRWTVPNAVVTYAGEDVICICLECLDEKRKNETD